MTRRLLFRKFFDGPTPEGILPPPAPAVVADPPEPTRGNRVICEGCGCSLDAAGKIIRRGEGLKAHLDREDETKELRKELDIKDGQIAELTAKVTALTPKPKRNILF